MSRRHQRTFMPISAPEIAAHRRAERQQVRAALAATTRLATAEEIDEPAVAYRPPHHRDPEHVHRRAASQGARHWKQPFWKRRTAGREQRVRTELVLRNL